VDIHGGDREQETPTEGREPPPHPAKHVRAATSDDVVGPLDRREEGVEVVVGPEFLGRGHKDQGKRGVLDRPGKRGASAVVRIDDHDLAGPIAIGQHSRNLLGDRARR